MNATRAAVVVAGEALIDLVRAPGGSIAAHPGGGPYNVARTLGRLEAPVRFLGRLSSDAFGRELRGHLEEDGVDCCVVETTNDPTTLALAELDAAGGATYRFYAEGTSAPGLASARVHPETPILCAGTLGLVFAPIAATLEGVIAGLGSGTLLALDPNCRPAAIRDAPAYRARLARLLARADVVKVSEEDLAWLDPSVPSPAVAARALLARPGAVALVTLGGAGALVVTRDGEAAVAAPAVAVVDTIGAGDAFMGGFLARWHERGLGREALGDRAALHDAAAFAARVASATCARAGADPPRRAELS